MPRKETDKIIQAALTPQEYEELKKLADERQWSVKKMTENIILWYLEENRKPPTKTSSKEVKKQG
jgi:hypothetical protein